MTRSRAPAIILDVDGVLLDWFGGFAGWMAENGHEVLPSGPHRYDQTDKYPGKTKEDLDDFIARFNVSDHFGTLPMIDGAHQGVAALKAALPGWRTAIVSSCGVSPRTVALRARSVLSFGIDELFLVPTGESKKPYLQRYGAGSIVIEDAAHHAVAAAELGHKTILLDQDWNVGEPAGDARRMASWAHIDEIINELAPTLTRRNAA